MARARISELRAEISALKTAVRDAERQIPAPMDREINIPIQGPGIEAWAKITIARDNQQAPQYGDEVRVAAALLLPADPSTGKHLHPAIQFQDRVKVAGQSLGYHWGHGAQQDFPGYIRYTYTSHRPTWAEAFEAAEAYGRAEIGNLTTALEARAAALAAAELTPVIE